MIKCICQLNLFDEYASQMWTWKLWPISRTFLVQKICRNVAKIKVRHCDCNEVLMVASRALYRFFWTVSRKIDAPFSNISFIVALTSNLAIAKRPRCRVG